MIMKKLATIFLSLLLLISALSSTVLASPTDTDNDGLSDEQELFYSTDPSNPDTDADGLLDGREMQLGINPIDPDTDHDLLPDKEDITVHSVERFEQEVAKAKTIFVAGPLGKFEEPGHRMGTERVFKTIAASTAFKVAGGGDTHKAISLLKLEGGFNWLSVGGGASLEFLAKRTLPGLAALLN